MSQDDPIVVRPLSLADESRWRELFRSYRTFYRLQGSEDVVSRVWSWMIDAGHECEALVAEGEGGILAIGHYRRFARPSTGTVGLWVDDLFTDPEARGKGAARALFAYIAALADSEGRSVVRWITADDNHRAKALYDRIANRTHWVVYDAAPAPTSPSE